MGVIGEAAGRVLQDESLEQARRDGLVLVQPLTSRRAGGDTGHVPGCGRDHALDTACGTRPLPVDADPHEAGLRRVQAARAALRENLRAGCALDEGQVATVLRVADALAAGVSLEARETLGREVRDVWIAWAQEQPNPKPSWLVPWEGLDEPDREADRRIGERLFALGRASVVPPDADMARILAAWRWLCAWDRDTLRLNAERYARAGIREVVERLFAKGDERGAVWVMLEFAPPPGLSVVGCDVDGHPATAEQWAKLRAAGVPVADGVGV